MLFRSLRCFERDGRVPERGRKDTSSRGCPARPARKNKEPILITTHLSPTYNHAARPHARTGETQLIDLHGVRYSSIDVESDAPRPTVSAAGRCSCRDAGWPLTAGKTSRVCRPIYLRLILNYDSAGHRRCCRSYRCRRCR